MTLRSLVGGYQRFRGTYHHYIHFSKKCEEKTLKFAAVQHKKIKE
jgi:hypothetical protein